MKKIKSIFKISTWNRFFSWNNTSSIGRLKFLNASYIIFIILPIIVKAFSNLEEIKFTIGNQAYSLDLELPFNWKLLYFSALALVIGNIFYYFSCPKIIRLYPDFEHYLKSGMPKIYLHRILAKYYVNRTGAEHLNDMVSFYMRYSNKHSINGYHIQAALESLRDPDPIAGGNFVFTQELMNYTYWYLRLITMLSYLTGLFLLLWVLIEKVLYTLNYLI